MATLRDLGSRRDDGPHRGRGARRRGRGSLAADRARCRSRSSTCSTRTATTARLAGAAGIPAGTRAAPASIDVGADGAVWPVAALAAGEAVLVERLDGPVRDLPTGAWDEPPHAGARRAAAAAGPRRPVRLPRRRAEPATAPLDDGYRGFVGLVAGQVAAGIASARAYEAERRRAEELAELDRAKTDVLHQRQPRAAHAADAAARPGRGRARRRRRRRCRPTSASASRSIHRNAQRLLKLVNTLLDFSRLESGRATARFEPVDLARYTAELASMFESAVERRGARARGRLPAAARAGLRRRGDVGEDRPEPALERAEVHVRGRGHGARSREAGRRRRARRSPTPASASPRRAGAAVRALPPRARRALAQPRGLGHRPGARGRAAGLHGGEVAVRERAGRGQHVHGAVPFGSRAPARRPASCRAARRRPTAAARRRGLPRRGDALAGPDAGRRRVSTASAAPGSPAADPRRRRQRRHARVRRVAARRRLRAWRRPRDGADGARAGARATRPTSSSPT